MDGPLRSQRRVGVTRPGPGSRAPALSAGPGEGSLSRDLAKPTPRRVRQDFAPLTSVDCLEDGVREPIQPLEGVVRRCSRVLASLRISGRAASQAGVIVRGNDQARGR